MALKCEHCQFNYEELDLTIRMSELLNDKVKGVLYA